MNDADRDLADQRRAGQHNLELEIAPPRHASRRVRGRAQALWDGKLGVIEVEGATDDQLTTLYSNLYRLHPLSELGVREHRHRERGRVYQHAVQSSTDDAAEHADRDRRAGRRRQGLRQQRLLGHVPHHVAGVLAARPADGGRAGRRLRPAVPRRRLDRALVVAGLREPDDRHELRRRVRRRLRQGRARASTPSDAYDAALKNATVAPPGDPYDPNVGPQGPRATRCSSATRRRACPRASRGRSRATSTTSASPTWPAELADAGARPPPSAGATQEEAEYFLSRAQNYVNMFDPAIGFFQGRAADGALEVRAGRVRPARVGPRARLHRDRRLELRVPRAAGRAGPGEPLRRPRRAGGEARRVLHHAGDGRSSPARTAGRSTR